MEMFGAYRLEALLGEGGMGEVHRAFDTRRERTVALKRLKPGLESDPDYQKRFRRESSLAARLSSPHVIPIHDFGEIDGRLFIDMRLVPGTDLGKLIATSGPLPPHRAVEIVRQIADALDSAHEDGLIHRDVKPSNVLITNNRGRDFAYLVDFGILRVASGTNSSLTATGSAIGTLAYMAPELFAGAQIDKRVDIYALGCLLFETLTGHPPFPGEGAALMYEHLNDTPPRLSRARRDIGQSLDPIISRAMAKDPQARFPTAVELAEAAHFALSSGAQLAPTRELTPAPMPPQAQASIPTYVPSRTPGTNPQPTPLDPSPASTVPPPGQQRRRVKLLYLLAAAMAVAAAAWLTLALIRTSSGEQDASATPPTATPPAASVAAPAAPAATPDNGLNGTPAEPRIEQAPPSGSTSAGSATTIVGNGDYLVRTDIAPGTYRSAGPDGSLGEYCFWSRHKDATGSSPIAASNSKGASVVTILPSDGMFQSKGCQTWTKVG